MYEHLEPFDAGTLPVGDGNTLYWEMCGNPAGKPAVVLHGGPGAGCTPTHRRLFDPEAYRIVLLDQRNCGRSTPHAADRDTDLSANTLSNLVADLEQLRTALRIDRWLVLGGSWGTTLGLAYAQQHPAAVTAMVLVSTALCRPSDIEWLYRDARRFMPDRWHDFVTRTPDARSAAEVIAAYRDELEHGSDAERDAAARDWCAWEAGVASVSPASWSEEPPVRTQLALARLCVHYFGNGTWLAQSDLLAGMSGLASIPARLIHGRFDLGVPVRGAWELSRAWPGSRLTIVDTAGHATADPGMADAIQRATDELR